jgi:hypothetical protein
VNIKPDFVFWRFAAVCAISIKPFWLFEFVPPLFTPARQVAAKERILRLFGLPQKYSAAQKRYTLEVKVRILAQWLVALNMR